MKYIIKLFALIAVPVSLLQADLKTDLITINSAMNELNSSISTTGLTSESMCAPLISLNKQAKSIVDAIIVINNGLTTPMTLDNETLVLTENLFINVASISEQSSLLSNEITLLQPATDAITLTDGIAAMLRLSSDIGEMADRIGEMADNILIMSDNIGLMADRILQTQVIQNENIALTQNSILQTQTNALALVSVVETASYDLSLNTLLADGNLLAAQLALVTLNPWNMAKELKSVKTEINAYLLKVKAFETALSSDSAQSTMLINTQSLDALVNMSLLMSSLGTVIDGYGVMIKSSQNLSSSATLLDAMGSMLSLSADIGKMSNSILEMSDLILVMADNIGMEADQILLTQELQNTNIATTQTSILAAQTLAVGIIATSN